MNTRRRSAGDKMLSNTPIAKENCRRAKQRLAGAAHSHKCMHTHRYTCVQSQLYANRQSLRERGDFLLNPVVQGAAPLQAVPVRQRSQTVGALHRVDALSHSERPIRYHISTKGFFEPGTGRSIPSGE